MEFLDQVIDEQVEEDWGAEVPLDHTRVDVNGVPVFPGLDLGNAEESFGYEVAPAVISEKISDLLYEYFVGDTVISLFEVK